MQLARVIGPVVSTIKHASQKGRTALMVQPLNPHGEPMGNPQVALDTVQAGEGDLVLVLDEGTGARQVLKDSTAPVRTVIVGIVDAVQLASGEPVRP